MKTHRSLLFFAGLFVIGFCFIGGCSSTYEHRRMQDLATMHALIEAGNDTYGRWGAECAGDPGCLDRARTLLRGMHAIAISWHLARASAGFRPNDTADRLRDALRTLQAMSIYDVLLQQAEAETPLGGDNSVSRAE